MSQHEEEHTPEIEQDEVVTPPLAEEEDQAAPGEATPVEIDIEVSDDPELFLDPDPVDVAVSDELAVVRAELEASRLELELKSEREAELGASLEKVEAEREDFKVRLLRAVADMENFRKRKEREREELLKYGSDKLVQDLLPAVDNLERALEHAEKTQGESSIIDGVRMVHRQLVSSLEKHGIRAFSSLGERFNPEMHEAIQQVESTEHDTGTIMQEFQKGYFLHDRLVRPALTVVARRVGPPAPESESSAEQRAEPDGIEDAVIEGDAGAEPSEAGAS